MSGEGSSKQGNSKGKGPLPPPRYESSYRHAFHSLLDLSGPDPSSQGSPSSLDAQPDLDDDDDNKTGESLDLDDLDSEDLEGVDDVTDVLTQITGPAQSDVDEDERPSSPGPN